MQFPLACVWTFIASQIVFRRFVAASTDRALMHGGGEALCCIDPDVHENMTAYAQIRKEREICASFAFRNPRRCCCVMPPESIPRPRPPTQPASAAHAPASSPSLPWSSHAWRPSPPSGSSRAASRPWPCGSKVKG